MRLARMTFVLNDGDSWSYALLSREAQCGAVSVGPGNRISVIILVRLRKDIRENDVLNDPAPEVDGQENNAINDLDPTG
jgi:hypothetical protein